MPHRVTIPVPHTIPMPHRVTIPVPCDAGGQLCALLVAHFPQDGADEERQPSGKDEARAVVGGVAPVGHPELPEDEAELHEVALRVRLLEVQGLLPLRRHAQLLNQRLVPPACSAKIIVSDPLRALVGCVGMMSVGEELGYSGGRKTSWSAPAPHA